MADPVDPVDGSQNDAAFPKIPGIPGQIAHRHKPTVAIDDASKVPVQRRIRPKLVVDPVHAIGGRLHAVARGHKLSIAIGDGRARTSPDGKLSVTDGPYAETKEQLAGFWIVEARDLNHAIQLMSKNPALRGGAIEIRPAADCAEMDSERVHRHARAK
jgi:hypothetical protein